MVLGFRRCRQRVRHLMRVIIENRESNVITTLAPDVPSMRSIQIPGLPARMPVPFELRKR